MTDNADDKDGGECAVAVPTIAWICPTCRSGFLGEDEVFAGQSFSGPYKKANGKEYFMVPTPVCPYCGGPAEEVEVL